MSNQLKKRNIYSIETVGWYDDDENKKPDRLSVISILDIVDELCGTRNINRTVATKSDLFYNLMKWKSLDFPILCLAFHGTSQGKIWMHSEAGEDDMVNYEVLAAHLRGACDGKVVHFSSCGSLRGMDYRWFLRETGATAVSGYAEDVEWTWATSFDLIYFEMLQYFGKKSVTVNVANKVKQQMFADSLSSLRKFLQFRMYVAT